MDGHIFKTEADWMKAEQEGETVSEFCVNCEETEKKLAFYVEQFKKVAEERDRFGKIETELIAERDALKIDLGSAMQITEKAEADRDHWKSLALKAREALVGMMKEYRQTLHLEHGVRPSGKDVEYCGAEAALALFPKEPCVWRQSAGKEERE